MYSNRLFTPLRYPGGKAAFAPVISRVMQVNGLDGGHYLEPYAGGAGVALDVLFSGLASHIHINDIDPAVHAFWQAVVSDADGLLRLIRDTPVTMHEWLKWRDVVRGVIEVSQTERGFATFFLNRTNRSGILKGGVIGGLSQSGTYKLDARYKKDVLTKRIELIAEQADRISVYCEDALILIRRAADIMQGRGLIYLDPPYFVKGKGLYRNYYSPSDHQSIADELQSGTFTTPWVVSYDDAPEIRAMYEASHGVGYSLNYTAQRKYRGSEAVFFSAGLVVPDLEVLAA